jgi:hypothetical protein
MSTIRPALLVVLAGLAMSAATTPIAMAAGFEWEANSELLSAGSSKEFSAKDLKPFTLKGTIGGATFEALSGKLKVAKGAEILGGSPGTNEELIEFESVKVDRPTGCSIKGGKLETKPLKSEIAESTAESESVDVLFIPKSGTTFAEFELEGSGCILKGIKPGVAGNVLAEVSPQGKEAAALALLFEAPSKEYRNSKEETAKAGLQLAGNAATLMGSYEMELTSKQDMGARGGALQSVLAAYTVSIPKGNEGEAVVLMRNTNPGLNLTIGAEPALAGEASWSKSAMQEAGSICKMGKVLMPNETCNYKVTFMSGAKAMGTYTAVLAVRASVGPARDVPLNGIVTN